MYLEIQLLSKHGLSLRRIAAEVGCAVDTVRRHLALEAVPKYERKVKSTTKLAVRESYPMIDPMPPTRWGGMPKAPRLSRYLIGRSVKIFRGWELEKFFVAALCETHLPTMPGKFPVELHLVWDHIGMTKNARQRQPR